MEIEKLVTEMDNSILELIISESIKDMCLYEEEDLEPILADIDKDNLSDLFFEKFIPYFELNVLEFTKNDLLFEIETIQNLKNNAKQNVKYFQGLLGKKLQPMSLLGTVKSGVNKAAKFAQTSNVGQAVVGGIAKTKKKVGGQIAKRLQYASQNLGKAAKIVKKKTDN